MGDGGAVEADEAEVGREGGFVGEYFEADWAEGAGVSFEEARRAEAAVTSSYFVADGVEEGDVGDAAGRADIVVVVFRR